MMDEILITIKNARRRDDVVPAYAAMICMGMHASVGKWHEVNQAIIDRWSPAAVDYIKRQAWKKIHSDRRVERAKELQAEEENAG